MKRVGLVLAFFLVFSLTCGFAQLLPEVEYALKTAEEKVDELIKEISEIKDGLQKIANSIEKNNALGQNSTPPVLPSPNFQNETKASLDSGIMGKGRSERNAVIAYIRTKNSSINFETIATIVDSYISEAEQEGVNHDFAIAQMCWATAYLTNHQRIAANNYGGLLNSRFSDRGTGVRAHIQHLKAYASTEGFKTKIVDPRYNVLVAKGLLGKITTRNQLYPYWSEARDYGKRIEGILLDLGKQFTG